MARTRGAAQTAQLSHDDDGVLLDKDGDPISVDQMGSTPMAPKVVPVVVQHPAAPLYRYQIGPETWQRNLDAWEVAQMLNLWLTRAASEEGPPPGFTLDFSHAEFERLHPDLKRHARRVAA